jgi:hypothetical protein
MLIKTNKDVRIPNEQWDALRHNPSFAELIELLEDQEALEKAKLERGEDITLDRYLKKRGIRNRS